MQTQTADINAQITKKLKLVDVVVTKMLRCGRLSHLDPDDARSAGMVALWRGLERHDPSKGPLDKYLRHRIRYAVMDAAKKGKRDQPDDEEGVEDLCVNDLLDERSVRAWRDSLGRAEYKEEFVKALRTLDDEEALVVSLIRRGYTRRQVVHTLGLRWRQLRVVLGRVWAKLRDFAP